VSTPEPVVIREYESASVELAQDDVNLLRRLGTHRVGVLPSEEVGTWTIQASSYVGTIATPNVRVLIRPKVSTANLFHLLEASGEALTVGPEVFDYDQTSNLIPAFATFFARLLERTLARGLYRGYQEEEDRLVGLRGRIDLRGLQRLAGVVIPVPCRFDEYTADVAINRIVKSAAARLVRLPGVTITTRQALYALLARLEEVGPFRDQDLRTASVFTRLNEHYRAVDRLGRMVVAGSSIRDEMGSGSASVFLINMNVVFEEFVEARLRRYLDGRLRVQGQAPTVLDREGKVGMRPDLLLRSREDICYVADAKYKIPREGYGRESDYYQLLAYTTALRLPEGVLIYCQDDGSEPAREIRVRHSDARLRTYALDLSGEPKHVEDRVRALADEINERSLEVLSDLSEVSTSVVAMR
jgi:5-methylcytosine-specific restriction enzyme subunit McrC